MYCRICHKDLPLEAFRFRKPVKLSSRLYECILCNRYRRGVRYLELSDQIKQQTNSNHRRRKELIFEHYGKKCACCEESNPCFLTIDHINNDGHKQRKQGLYKSLYSYIIRENFPDDLQTLCYNCNMGKARNKGICPHKG